MKAVLVLLAPLAACVDVVATDVPGPGGAMHAQGEREIGDQAPVTFTGVGAYAVPVEPELLPYAAFAVDITMTRDGNAVALSFELPDTLTGYATELTASGLIDANGPSVVEGANVRGTCEVTPALRCELSYEALTVAPEAARNAWIARGVGGAELEARVRVSQIFRDDPLGILSR